MRHRNGFTLIELSMVLIVIGLIVVGVTGGKSLMKAAELRGIITQYNNYKTAINAFDLQYDALPGDMPDASDYWGSACGGAVAAPAGCNGDGDGFIDPGASTEEYRFWQHLVLSEVLPGDYTGEADGVYGIVAGVNVPSTKIDGVYFRSEYKTYSAYNLDANIFSIQQDIANSTENQGGFLSPPEAVSFDKKIDDGFAATGNVFARNGWVGSEQLGCLDKGTSPYTYDKSNSDEHCRFYIKF